MTTDKNTRLLYAILSQKCLKDIDWNKVARDPVLAEEITNGHAARMRYSRFKKQMDGTPTVRKPRNPSASPRKSKVEKNKFPNKKIKERNPSTDDNKIKAEAGEAGSSQDTYIEGTPEARPDSQYGSPVHIVKREPGLQSGYPLTPMGSQSQSHSPSPGFGEVSDMEMMASFGMPNHAGMAGEQGLYHQEVGVMPDSSHGFGISMPMEMSDSYAGLWHQQAHAEAQAQEEGRGGTLVKTEPRWEEIYRQV